MKSARKVYGRAKRSPAESLPHCAEAEVAILGAMLVNNNHFDRAVTLTSACFYVPANRMIFGSMARLRERHVPADLVTVQQDLVETGELEAVGGIEYIASLMDGIPHLTNIDHYVEMIGESAARRQIIAAADRAKAAAMNGSNLTAAEIAAHAAEAMRPSATSFAVDLRTLSRPEPEDEIRVEGLAFPRRHASIIFGDGGAAKSYTALYLAGLLAMRGLRIALFDWELCGEDHRDRFERLFGSEMPRVLYCRCELPLIGEVSRLRRIVREHKVDFAMYDSVAFACHGRPEDAEIAAAYFRAVREIGCGSLHLAHVNRSDDNDKKPFGSIFWHNSARSTWYVQAAETADDGAMRLGLFHRKSNLGRRYSPVSFALTFTPERTEFRRADIADSPDLSAKLTVRQRMQVFLRTGARTVEEIAAEFNVKPDTVRRTAQRYRSEFIDLDDKRIGLKEKSA
jgi:hypothetical protein